MPSFKIAHILHDGANLVVVPVSTSFGRKTEEQRRQILDELRRKAFEAGIPGTVIPVWDSGGGKMGFVAPTGFHAFLQGLRLPQVLTYVNRTLSW